MAGPLLRSPLGRSASAGLARAVTGATALACGCLVCLACEREARADDPCRAAPLVSSCIDADTFWPHAGPQRFAGVGGVETLQAGRFGFAIVADYQSRPIVFHVPSPPPSGTDQYGVDNQVNGSFLWSYGITRKLELDFILPVTFGQTGSGAAPLSGGSGLHDTALRDLRFGVAYQLVPRADAEQLFAVTARFEMSAPTGDRDQYAGDRTAVYIPSVAADLRAGRWFAGLELGARLRPNDQILGATVGPQGLAALGVGYDVLARRELLSVMAEARTLPTFAAQSTATQTPDGIVEQTNGSFLAPSEWMLSVRTSPLAAGDLAVTAGGGGAIPTGGDASVTVPRFRFMLGVSYAPSSTPQKEHP
jgi:hypothetical protein